MKKKYLKKTKYTIIILLALLLGGCSYDDSPELQIDWDLIRERNNEKCLNAFELDYPEYKGMRYQCGMNTNTYGKCGCNLWEKIPDRENSKPSYDDYLVEEHIDFHLK